MNAMYQQRLTRVRQNMKEQGLPQILVSSTESVFYLTGLWIVPMERQLALYLHQDGQCAFFGIDLLGITSLPGWELHLLNVADDPVADIA